MRLWSLMPGEYEYRRGPDLDQNDEMDGVDEQTTLKIHSPGAPHEFELPPEALHMVELRFLRPIAGIPAQRPDVAVGAEDLVVYPPKPAQGERIFVGARIHNIGNAPATKILAQIHERKGSQETLVTEQYFEEIDAPNDIVPRAVWVWADHVMNPGVAHLSVSARIVGADLTKEFTQENNKAERSIALSPTPNAEFAQRFWKGSLTDPILPVWLELAQAFSSNHSVVPSEGRIAHIKVSLNQAETRADEAEKRMITALRAYVGELETLRRQSSQKP
jgi:hypothetical protein